MKEELFMDFSKLTQEEIENAKEAKKASEYTIEDFVNDMNDDGKNSEV